jgi:mono/diheme cytochrome c family protein
MNYPFWDVDIGYGVLMAIISVVHVFVSHFAIGGGLYLVVAETAARKKGDGLRLEFLQKLSKFFVLVTVVFGALTGVGIWFVIGLLNPAATELLIHNFVWGWATEWTFFVMEIAASLVYMYTWKTLSPRNHMIVGWIYFVAAWMSLFIINGIIAFMLTPGAWLQTGNFWDGFFNPTFWPALIMRTGVCVMLAGLYAMLVASRYQASDFKARVVRYNAAWGIIGLAVTLPSFYWYWKAIPAAITTAATLKMPSVISSVNHANWLAGAIAIMLVVFGLILPRRQVMTAAVVTMIFGLAWFGYFEWFREEIRKPYVVYGYMYANAVEVPRAETYQKEGYLSQIAFKTGNDGADLFRRACRSCHTLRGYRALGTGYDGTDSSFIAGTIRGAHVIRGGMPPFLGTDIDVGLLAAHIYGQIDKRPLAEIYRLSGVPLGKKVYDIRCGKCHVFGGYSDKSASLLGLTDKDYNDLLDMSGEMAAEMPAFTGDSTERAALIEYWKSLGQGGQK